jgi:8-oxo-dGTP diphosphatase
MDSLPSATRVSAGGVVFRLENGLGNAPRVEVALIHVPPKGRWQLPKGNVGREEANEQAALREVREETGLEAELLGELERIEYWFYSTRSGKRTRFHKFVYFYLMRYISGSVNDHDHEVDEARWVDIHDALQMLAFESEKVVLRKAHQKILEEML